MKITGTSWYAMFDLENGYKIKAYGEFVERGFAVDPQAACVQHVLRYNGHIAKETDNASHQAKKPCIAPSRLFPLPHCGPKAA